MPSLRFDEGKPQLHYLRFYPYFKKCFSWVQEMGAFKYGYLNWTEGGKEDREYLNSIERHIDAWVEGEDYDPDTGAQHLACAAWNLMNLMEQNYRHLPIRDPDFDVEAFKSKWADHPKNEISWQDFRANRKEEKSILADIPPTIEVEEYAPKES